LAQDYHDDYDRNNDKHDQDIIKSVMMTALPMITIMMLVVIMT